MESTTTFPKRLPDNIVHSQYHSYINREGLAHLTSIPDLTHLEQTLPPELQFIFRAYCAAAAFQNGTFPDADPDFISKAPFFSLDENQDIASIFLRPDEDRDLRNRYLYNAFQSFTEAYRAEVSATIRSKTSSIVGQEIGTQGEEYQFPGDLEREITERYWDILSESVCNTLSNCADMGEVQNKLPRVAEVLKTYLVDFARQNYMTELQYSDVAKIPLHEAGTPEGAGNDAISKLGLRTEKYEKEVLPQILKHFKVAFINQTAAAIETKKTISRITKKVPDRLEGLVDYHTSHVIKNPDNLRLWARVLADAPTYRALRKIKESAGSEELIRKAVTGILTADKMPEFRKTHHLDDSQTAMLIQAVKTEPVLRDLISVMNAGLKKNIRAKMGESLKA